MSRHDVARPLRRTLVALAVLSVAGVFAPPADAQKPQALFTEASSAAPPVVEKLMTPQVSRLRFTIANLDLIGGPDRPAGADALRLNLFEDVEFVAVRDRLERRGRSSYSWFGHLADDRQTNVILVVRDQYLTGHVMAGGRIFDVVALDGDARQVVREIDQSKFLPDEPRDVLAPPGDGAAPRAAPADREALSKVLADACGDDDFIDVLVVYTADADAAPGDILGEIQAAIDDSNQSYMNSGIVQRLRLVRAEQVAYVESGDAPTDRNRLRDPADGFMDGVHAVRDTYGADIVSLWTESSNYCGYAFIMETVGAAFESSAFNAVTRSCAVGNHSFAHELGHNMSARHDRYVDGTDGSPFMYNHGFVNIDDAWRTIMSYNDACEDAGTSCTRLQFWSNPDITYGGDPMGIADGNPDAADNRTTLNATRTTVQDFRHAHAPLANAGPDQVAECGLPTALDGSAACDPDGDALTYAWTGGFIEGGGTATGVSPLVTFPKGVFPVTLTVNDGLIASVPDTVSVDATADLTAPAVVCPANVTVSCDAVTQPPATGVATATDACDATPTVSFADVETPGACAQEKTITRTWSAEDDDSNGSACVQTVTVDDSTAPVVSCAVATPRLWPANHRWVDVGFTYEAPDDCDAQATASITVTSDEDPALVPGAGGPLHCPDASVDPETGTVRLRAERSGAGDGRVYVVTVTVTDACGNAGSCSATVTVPKSANPASTPVDSGQAWDAAACGEPGFPGRGSPRRRRPASRRWLR